MRLADYVMQFISKLGVNHVFFLSGGGAMHLNDALGRNKNLTPVCMLHEQAAAIAAESYARISQGFSVCLVTSGPGVTNALTGLASAYLDSLPVIFISGQVKRADQINGQGIRQFGIQEIEVIPIVKNLTKYAVCIDDPLKIKYELEKAINLAMDKKPGPVWIDIPLDMQATDINTNDLVGYDKTELTPILLKKTDIDKTIALLNGATRPVILLGNGIRLGGATEEMRLLVEKLGIPVLTTWNGVDLIEDDHPLYFGRPGAVGHRHSNFIQQNADCFISIGARLNLLSTGFDYNSFLKKAKHIMVEIDENELKKKNVRPFLPICANAKDFINELLLRIDEIDTSQVTDWVNHCLSLKKRYPLFFSEQAPLTDCINTYQLVNEVSKQMSCDDIFQFTSSGTAVDISMQAFRVKFGQRTCLSKGLASMGFDLPASIGSCLSSGLKRTICITGDGGFMMNIQELETLRRLDLPVKIFILDNNGYGMIYLSQNGVFNGNLTGCNNKSGLTIPNLSRVIEAFGIPVAYIENENELADKVSQTLNSSGPATCIIKIDIGQKILPRQTNYVKTDGQMASRPLEDMSPLLSREEFGGNMV